VMEVAPWGRRVGYAHCVKFSESPRRVAALLRPKSTQSPNLLTFLTSISSLSNTQSRLIKKTYSTSTAG
jgi:hypothetical protein